MAPRVVGSTWEDHLHEQVGRSLSRNLNFAECSQITISLVFDIYSNEILPNGI